MRARTVLVLGVGETGLSMARHLHAAGHRVLCTDTRAEPPGLARLREVLPDVPFHPGGTWSEAFEAVEEVCVSPGVAPSLPLLVTARARGVPCVGDVELFARVVRTGVVGVTGTNGKSTVTALLARFGNAAGERCCAGGNLMPPALDLLGRGCARYVLEISSFQLEFTRSLHLDVAVHTNVAPDHLDRHGDLEAYTQAKRRIFRDARHAVVNARDRRTRPPEHFTGLVTMVNGPRSRWRTEEAGSDGAVRIVHDGRPLIDARELRILGAHNVENAVFALAAGEVLGYPVPVMLEALVTFEGLPHRCESVGTVGGVRFVNDSKATNGAATRAAVESLAPLADGRLVLIAGGVAKETDFSALAETCAGQVREALLTGPAAPALARDLAAADVPHRIVPDLATAVREGHAAARPDGVVLLSPACTSFDAFRDFEARGEAFRELVDELREGAS